VLNTTAEENMPEESASKGNNTMSANLVHDSGNRIFVIVLREIMEKSAEKSSTVRNR
jgi:hypothetical protein